MGINFAPIYKAGTRIANFAQEHPEAVNFVAHVAEQYLNSGSGDSSKSIPKLETAGSSSQRLITDGKTEGDSSIVSSDSKSKSSAAVNIAKSLACEALKALAENKSQQASQEETSSQQSVPDTISFHNSQDIENESVLSDQFEDDQNSLGDTNSDHQSSASKRSHRSENSDSGKPKNDDDNVKKHVKDAFNAMSPRDIVEHKKLFQEARPDSPKDEVLDDISMEENMNRRLRQAQMNTERREQMLFEQKEAKADFEAYKEILNLWSTGRP